MSNNESSHGQTQDRSQVASRQEFEANYDDHQPGRSIEAVKEASTKIGNQRTQIEGYIKSWGYQGF